MRKSARNCDAFHLGNRYPVIDFKSKQVMRVLHHFVSNRGTHKPKNVSILRWQPAPKVAFAIDDRKYWPSMAESFNVQHCRTFVRKYPDVRKYPIRSDHGFTP